MSTAISMEHVSKEYRLGVINHGMLYKDIQSKLARVLGRPDPNEKIGALHYEDAPDRFWALKDVSFDIEQGDRVGIIGRNGAGKSTLLKILSRITAPTEGRIRIRGRVASLLEVGTGFHPELTGRENIFLNGAILGMKRQQVARRLDEIIAFSEIEKFIDTPVKRYSSGMYVRLAFAVAAHLDSDILLADEVLAVGDASFQKKSLGKLEDVSKNQGKTVIFVSHNLGAVKGLCTSIALLRSGELVGYSRGHSLIATYLQNSTNDKLFTEWTETEAPRTSYCRVSRIAAVDAAGKDLRAIGVGDPFYIETSFEVSKDHTVVGLTLLFIDDEGRIVFSTMGNTAGNLFGTPLSAGPYRSRCAIPGDLLNAITYRVSLIVYTSNFAESLQADDILAFDVGEGGTVRHGFWGEIKGVLRPSFEWTMRKAE